MDGLQARLNASMQWQLAFWLSLAIGLIGLAAGAFAYLSAYDEAHELQDDMLRQVATMFQQHRLVLPFVPDPSLRPASDEAPQVRVQALGAPVDPAAPDAVLPLPPTLAAGLHTVDLPDGPHRVYVLGSVTGQRLAVSQSAGVRDAAARDSAQRAVLPFLLLWPVLLLAVRYVVRRLFRPVAALAGELDARPEHALHPLATAGLGSEIQPFVTAINRLLDRVARAMAAQQRFVADAAHELRSPLTALSLQAERLAQTDLDASARQRLQPLREGIARSRQLLEQLLSLARAQASGGPATEALSVPQVVSALLAERQPLAEAKQLDLGVEDSEPLMLDLPEADLRMLLGNLLDNAIRYTPAGGRVDLTHRRDAGQVLLQVSDSGPGIAPAERERVFDPFYRVLGSTETGSGLGLSIVRAIADRWHAQVELGWTDPAKQRGLRVSVRLPGPAP